jgi:hypothetical protein
VVLGHTEAFVTQIYAERDFSRAEAIMRELASGLQLAHWLQLTLHPKGS